MITPPHRTDTPTWSVVLVAGVTERYSPANCSGIELQDAASKSNTSVYIERDNDNLLETILAHVHPGDHILIMSNGGFGGIHQKLLDGLALKG